MLFYFYVCSIQSKWKAVARKQKMDNPTFVDEENILMIHQDEEEDYNDYRTLDTSRIEISFIESTDATEATSTLRLRQKLKRDKIVSLYRYLSVTGDPGLADLD